MRAANVLESKASLVVRQRAGGAMLIRLLGMRVELYLTRKAWMSVSAIHFRRMARAILMAWLTVATRLRTERCRRWQSKVAEPNVCLMGFRWIAVLSEAKRQFS